MADWEYLLQDDYRSPQFDELHARLENYQIYSLVWCDFEGSLAVTEYFPSLHLPDVSVRSGITFVNETVPIVTFGSTRVTGGSAEGYWRIAGVKIYARTIPPGAYPYPVFSAVTVEDGEDPDGAIEAGLLAQDFTLIHTRSPVTVPYIDRWEVQTVTVPAGRYQNSMFPDVRNRNSMVTNSGMTKTSETLEAVAFQSFDPSGKIPIDFAQIAMDFPRKASKRTVYFSREISKNIVPSFQLELKTEAPSYINLIQGYAPDNRTIGAIEAVATTTRIIKFGCYCRNKYETHPRLKHSLDWRTGEISVSTDKRYELPIKDLVLGTLVVDGTTKNELLNFTIPANLYPRKYLFQDGLADLFGEWRLLFSDPPDNQPVHPFANTYTSTSLDESGNQTILTFTKIIQTFKTVVRVMAANNDVWGHGAITIPQNRPPNDHDIFDFDHQDLSESPQSDGSFGTYMTDSPRLREIHAALEAQKYAIDPQTNLPRVANLGHFIEKMAGFIGYRPEPNGTIDTAKEASTYARKEIDPKAPYPDGQYVAGRFGTKAMLLKRAPNKKTATGWTAGGMIAVHDLPQLIAEIFDQQNTALNLQESTSIQIRDGDGTYEYPNQLALLIEIATAVIQQRRHVRETWTSSIVTQNTVNEVIGGLGLPAVSKSISVNNQTIPYWGIQPNASIQREIATVAQNVGNVQGQVL